MIRNLNAMAAYIFIFLAALLTISRLPLEGFLPPALFFVFSLGTVAAIIWVTGGFRSMLLALGSIAAFCALILFWTWLTRGLYSPGDDEYIYHIHAIWDIAAGWHPFFSPHNNIWVDSYPSGLWTLQSYIVSLTGQLMSGQALLIGFMAVTALLAYGFYLERIAPVFPLFPPFAALVFTGLVVANPVVLTQIMTHYVDAPMYLVGAALVFFLVLDGFGANRLARWAAIACILLLLNTKTAALYFTPLIVVGGFLMELVLRKGEGSLLQRMCQWMHAKGSLYVLAALFAVIVIGYKPYVTNITDHGEFIHPPSDEIMGYNVPRNIIPLSIPEKFIYGLLAKTGESRWPVPLNAPVTLKIPGAFNMDEFRVLRYDTRRGGFGPFIALAFFAAIGAFAVARFSARNKTDYDWHPAGDGLAVMALTLLVSSALFPEPWWARYIPLLWLGIILLAISSLMLSGKGTGKLISRGLLTVTIVALTGCIAAGMVGALRQNLNAYYNSFQIEQMKQFPIIELYGKLDIRITKDQHSKSTGSEAETWQRLLELRGVNSRIGGQPRGKQKCELDGVLTGNLYWCAPKTSGGAEGGSS